MKASEELSANYSSWKKEYLGGWEGYKLFDFFVVVVVYVLLMLLSNFHISISSGYLHPHSSVDSIKDVVRIFFLIKKKKKNSESLEKLLLLICHMTHSYIQPN